MTKDLGQSVVAKTIHSPYLKNFICWCGRRGQIYRATKQSAYLLHEFFGCLFFCLLVLVGIVFY